MVKNTDVISEFINFGDNKKIKTKHLFFEGDVLFSYGSHYPLCIRLKDGFIINDSGYSMTTATHTGYLIREVTNCLNLKELEKEKKKGNNTDIILNKTSEMKDIINDNENLKFITISELKKLRILKNL